MNLENALVKMDVFRYYIGGATYGRGCLSDNTGITFTETQAETVLQSFPRYESSTSRTHYLRPKAG